MLREAVHCTRRDVRPLPLADVVTHDINTSKMTQRSFNNHHCTQGHHTISLRSSSCTFRKSAIRSFASPTKSTLICFIPFGVDQCPVVTIGRAAAAGWFVNTKEFLRGQVVSALDSMLVGGISSECPTNAKPPGIQGQVVLILHVPTLEVD